MRVYKSLKMQIEENLAKIELDGELKGNISRITIKPEKEYPIIKNTLVIGRHYDGVFVRKNKEVKNITISIKIAGKGKTEIWITVFPYNEDY